ncbi:MAG: hypothetical protein WCF67_21490 [Chitinophagaceae bacterium]
MKKISWLFLFILTTALAFAQDSTEYAGKAGITDVADSDPGLFFVMMLILMGLIAAAAICLFLAAMVALIIFIFISAGILSLSVFMGWYRKSFKAGLRWLVLLTFGAAGTGGGILSYFIYLQFNEAPFQWHHLLLYAIPGGLLGGLLCGLLFLFLLFMMAKFLQSRYQQLRQ